MRTARASERRGSSVTMGEERKVSGISLANRFAPLELPVVALVATFLTFVIGYRIPWAEAIATAFTIGVDTYLWIAVGFGFILMVFDFLTPKRKKLIFVFYIALSIVAAAAGWVIGEAVMHI